MTIYRDPTQGHDSGLPSQPSQISEWDRLRSVSPARAPAEAQQHGLEFTGSGSEYFRIWIVNLLLTLVTLGLYYPWAKVRKLRYFYGNTRLGGHAFDFHGDPKRMLRGYLLVGALFTLYAVAGRFSPLAGVVALLVVAGLWPALLRASLRFRLAQTSWRGLRFRFTGEMAGVYRALAPATMAVVVMLAVVALFMPEPDDAAELAAGSPAPLALFFYFVALIAVIGLAPLTFWMLKRYQHGNYQYASVRTRFTADAKSFYLLGARAFGVSLLAGVVFAVIMALAGAGAGAGAGRSFGAMVFGLVVAMLGYAVMLAAIQPYIVSRLQNLVWDHTDSRNVGFDSNLRFWPFARLSALNWVLVALTLGLYWPFAAVAAARLRLEAVDVLARTNLDTLVARASGSTSDASGDAAADLFGIDIGL